MGAPRGPAVRAAQALIRLLVTGTGAPLAAPFAERMAGLAEVVTAGPVALPGRNHLPVAALDRQAAAGASHLVHFDGCAAEIEGVLEGAEAAGVRRLVWVTGSRCRCLSFDPEARTDGRAPSAVPLDPWPEAADRAARLGRALGWRGRMSVVGLLHGWLLDPLDTSGDAGRLRGALRGERPRDRGGTAVVDARDLLGGIESALHRGRGGGAYVLASRNVRWTELWGWCRRGEGESRPSEPGEPPIGRFGEMVDDSPARAELGWWHRRPDRTLVETFGGPARRGAP